MVKVDWTFRNKTGRMVGALRQFGVREQATGEKLIQNVTNHTTQLTALQNSVTFLRTKYIALPSCSSGISG